MTQVRSDIKKENLIFWNSDQTFRCFIEAPYLIFPWTLHSLRPSLIMYFLHNNSLQCEHAITKLIFNYHLRLYWSRDKWSQTKFRIIKKTFDFLGIKFSIQANLCMLGQLRKYVTLQNSWLVDPLNYWSCSGYSRKRPMLGQSGRYLVESGRCQSGRCWVKATDVGAKVADVWAKAADVLTSAAFDPTH